nr:futalosine hydrolase [Desulfobulbaceae bacterium]
MLLLAAATELELKPLTDLLGQHNTYCHLITGVGLLETAITLTSFIGSTRGRTVSGVVNFGVAGGFHQTGVKLLDICLAENERLADLGICYGDRIEAFDSLDLPTFWEADRAMLSAASSAVYGSGLTSRKGSFISVNGVSGSDSRAEFFWKRFQPLCENMEGAAVMRVCQQFDLPCLEVRAISNFVENRNPASWKLEEAAVQCAKAVACIVESL